MMNYILIGIAFMFLFECFASSNKTKKYYKKVNKSYKEFGFWERTLGILFWPIYLGIFLYHFFKEFFR